MPDLNKLSWNSYMRDTDLSQNSVRQPRPVIQNCTAFKEYPKAERIDLPPDQRGQADDLWQILQQRRSHRKYSSAELSLHELSLLLWASQGITAQAGHYLFRTAPSAGALYPIETYLCVNSVEEIPAGLYHFSPPRFGLEKLYDAPAGEHVARAALGQRFLADCGAVFIWSAMFRRNMSKYGNRGLRYILMDAGHICQNLLLAAEALDLGACPVAAFFDREMNDLLDLDGEEESVLYMAAVGKRS